MQCRCRHAEVHSTGAEAHPGKDVQVVQVLQVLQVLHMRYEEYVLHRFRGSEVQRFRGSEVQRCRSVEMQRCRYGGDEIQQR